MAIVKEVYTRKVSGESFDYELDYTQGADVAWIARVYHDGVLKGSPHGALTANVLSGPALEQYLRAYVEGMIERGSTWPSKIAFAAEQRKGRRGALCCFWWCRITRLRR